MEGAMSLGIGCCATILSVALLDVGRMKGNATFGSTSLALLGRGKIASSLAPC